MRFGSYYKNKENVEVLESLEQVDEASAIQNAFYTLIGSEKRKVDPKAYSYNYVVGSTGFGNLLNLLTSQVTKTLDGNPPTKRKLYARSSYVGALSNINSLYNVTMKNPSTKEPVKFWEPVEKINSITIFKTNVSALSIKTGDIVLWDVTTKDDFSEMEDPDKLDELGWQEGTRQFVVSTNDKGAKYWRLLVGMPLPTWVTASKIGQIKDPYGFAYQDDVALLKKRSSRSELVNAFIPKDLYNKLVPAQFAESFVVEASDFKSKAKDEKYMVKQSDGVWRTLIQPNQITSAEPVIKSTLKYFASKKDGTLDPSLQDELDNYVSDKLYSAKSKQSKTSQQSKPTTQVPPSTAHKLVVDNIMLKQVGNDITDGPIEITTDASNNTEAGVKYTFNNGGTFFVYKVKNAPSENEKYKIAFDEKGKQVASKISDLKRYVNSKPKYDLK